MFINYKYITYPHICTHVRERLQRSFDLIFLKRDRRVGTKKTWTYVASEPNQLNEGELGVTQISEFLRNESLTTDFAETHQVDNMLWKMVFLKFLTQLVPFGR